MGFDRGPSSLASRGPWPDRGRPSAAGAGEVPAGTRQQRLAAASWGEIRRGGRWSGRRGIRHNRQRFADAEHGRRARKDWPRGGCGMRDGPRRPSLVIGRPSNSRPEPIRLTPRRQGSTRIAGSVARCFPMKTSSCRSSATWPVMTDGTSQPGHRPCRIRRWSYWRRRGSCVIAASRRQTACWIACSSSRGPGERACDSRSIGRRGPRRKPSSDTGPRPSDTTWRPSTAPRASLAAGLVAEPRRGVRPAGRPGQDGGGPSQRRARCGPDGPPDLDPQARREPRLRTRPVCPTGSPTGPDL